jgi:hypothetical protein
MGPESEEGMKDTIMYLVTMVVGVVFTLIAGKLIFELLCWLGEIAGK